MITMNKTQKAQIKRRLQEVGMTEAEIKDIIKTQSKRS
jgi:DNA-binding transcriptional MerR regulator